MGQRTHSGEKRTSKRLLSRVRVHFGTRRPEYLGFALNLSARGLYRALGGLLLAATLTLSGCARHGREVFVREGCGNCHRFHDLGGGGAPNLDGVASRLDAESIRAQITNPGAGGTRSRMPAFGRLSWYDLHSLVAFLRD